MRSGILVALVTSSVLSAAACGRAPAAVTFTKDIAPILFANCASCHRPGEVAPFSLLTYADAVKHADKMAKQTLERHMPPWLPERGEFPILGERRLRDDQIDAIQRWVKSGKAEGHPADLPKAPEWPAGWQLGRPDEVLTPAQPFRMNPTTEGRIHGWDVVNEAIDEDGSLRKAPWRDGIGDDYVAKAFEFAREADPDAELYYNDYNLEKPAKRAGVIRLVKDLQKRGLRIDGIGNQGHWQLETPTIDDIEKALTELHGTGLNVMYTELDINMLPPAGPSADPASANPYVNGLPDEKQRQLAKRYADIFGVIVKHRDWVSRVTFWGLSDADSWLNRGRMNYPLLWDRQRLPKPAFQAIVDVLRRAR